MSFIKFNSFPTEIRLAIWKWSIPAEPAKHESEVWCWGRPHTTKHHSHEQHPVHDPKSLIADMPFPAIMHVCRESRELVLDSKTSGISFCDSPAANCMVPFRHFRPEQDILKLNHGDWSVVCRLDKDEPFFLQIRSLAFLSLASRLSFRCLVRSMVKWVSPETIYFLSWCTYAARLDGKRILQNILQQDQEDQEDIEDGEEDERNDMAFSDFARRVFPKVEDLSVCTLRLVHVGDENLAYHDEPNLSPKHGAMTEVKLANKPTSIIFEGQHWRIRMCDDGCVRLA